jgi:hypothetical protein
MITTVNSPRAVFIHHSVDEPKGEGMFFFGRIDSSGPVPGQIKTIIAIPRHRSPPPYSPPQNRCSSHGIHTKPNATTFPLPMSVQFPQGKDNQSQPTAECCS